MVPIVRVTKAGKQGLCNIEGKQIVPCGYDSVWYYPDEKGMVREEQNGKKVRCKWQRGYPL